MNIFASFALVVLSAGSTNLANAQYLSIAEWELADPNASIEGFNVDRDASIRALRGAAADGFTGYQDYTVVRNMVDTTVVTVPTILSMTQWTTAEAGDVVPAQLVGSDPSFAAAWAAVVPSANGGFDYTGNGFGNVEDLSLPFQAVGVVYMPNINIANFAAAADTFATTVVGLQGVRNILYATGTDDAIVMIVFTNLDAFDANSGAISTAATPFFTEFPSTYARVGVDTDVGVEGSLNRQVSLSVWTVKDDRTIDEFRPLRDASIRAMREKSDDGFTGYQDFTLDSQLTTFNVPTIIAVVEYENSQVEDKIIADLVATNADFVTAFTSVDVVASYSTNEVTGQLSVEDLNEPMQAISYTAFTFTDYADFQYIEYQPLLDAFITALESQNGVLKVWLLAGTIDPAEVILVVLEGLDETKALLDSGFFTNNPAAANFLTVYQPSSTYTGIDTDMEQEGKLLEPTAAPTTPAPSPDSSASRVTVLGVTTTLLFLSSALLF